MSGSTGLDRLARRLAAQAATLEVPTIDRVINRPSILDFASACGMSDPDPWQRKVLTSEAYKQCLLCSRQAGKTMTSSIIALDEACFRPGALVLVLSPTQGQSSELCRKITLMHKQASLVFDTIPAIRDASALRIAFANDSRIIALSGSEVSVRGWSACTLLLVDEASRVPDELIAAVRPTQATTNGRLIYLSTPAGRRGAFFEVWDKGDPDEWEKTSVVASDIPRISPRFLAEQRRELGEYMYQQEYELAFLDDQTSAFASVLIEAMFADDAITPLWDDL